MKISKSEAMYEDRAKGNDKCRDCVHFNAPNLCNKVVGAISPGGWCELFSRKSRMAESFK